MSHLVVYWEKLKRDIMQCKKCQRIGHAAVNCNMQYRCVKCNIEHKSGDCKNNGKKSEDLFCINYNALGHPASYRGCPKIKEIKKAINIKFSNTIKRNTKDASSLIKPGKSFADAVSKNEPMLLNQMNTISDRSKVNNTRINTFNTTDLDSNNITNLSNLYQTSLKRISNLEKSVEDVFKFLNIINEKLDYLSVNNG